MRWTAVMNERLAKATGFRVVRNGGSPHNGSASAPIAALPRHVDEQAADTIRVVRPRTMTGHAKLFALIVATRYVVDHGIPGDVVECGVWRGGSMQAVARTLLERRQTDRRLHLYDTFDGMPPARREDIRQDGQAAVHLLQVVPRSGRLWAVARLDDVREGMTATGYPLDRVHFHPGLVEDTIPDEAPEEIALLRLDTDWYASTRHELDHLYDRVPSGGVVFFDDYGYWDGARRAVDEFLQERGERLLLVSTASGCV